MLVENCMTLFYDYHRKWIIQEEQSSPTMNIQSLVVYICASFTLKNKIYYMHYNMYQIPECYMENLLRLRRQD